jgi:hypothetical protein
MPGYKYCTLLLPIWVRIDIRRSFWGNILAMLYRPERVSLTLFTRSGRTYGGRLLPAVARAGFLLSPVVENRQSFFALASTNWQQELAGLEVASVRITADGGKEAASCYQSPVRLRFYRLDFQRQDWVKDAKEDALVTVRTGEGTHAYLRARR